MRVLIRLTAPYARLNFKLNRAAALAEWRQLLSA